MAIIKIKNAAIDLDAAEIPNLPATKITSGTMATARLGSGTASSSTFLRGDSTFASAGSPSITDNGNATALTIDSSENVLIGTTTEASDDVGHALLASGSAYHTADGTYVGLFNRKSSNGEVVQIRKDNTVVGKIGIESTGFTVDGEANHSGVRFSSASFLPRKNYSDADGTVDLGTTDGRWKDLYLSGGAFIGGTGTANKLDDYEEGTWTPVVNTANGFSTGITSTSNAKYIKIGNLVTVQCYIQMGNSSGNLALEDNVTITGIPFTGANTEASSCCAYRYNSNNGIFAVYLNTTSVIFARCQQVNGSPTRNGGSIALNYTYQTA